MVLTLLLAVPAVTGLWLVTGGRRMTLHWARRASAASSGLTLALAVVTAVARPEVDVAWLP
ncbi:MAG: complex I subunit 4 family protein, partial [Phycicoccus sp.]